MSLPAFCPRPGRDKPGPYDLRSETDEMETFWFIVVAGMLAIYVVLDGFDLGAGIIHHLVAKDAGQRRIVLRAIGPVWDGNEVWLLAAGGALFFAFPILYAASFSGFYLPLMMVLWLLMLRGIGIELRSHLDHGLWQSFWDFVFSVASALLAVFFGAAFGNVMRGVPLNGEKSFFEPLWTDFRVGLTPGILDWYTVLAGLVALVALAVHGANYIAAKTEGEINERARRVAAVGWWALVLLTLLSLVATLSIHPQLLDNYRSKPWGGLFPLLVLTGLCGMKYFQRARRDWPAFLSSSIYLVGMLAGAAFGMYPIVLPASTDSRYSLTIYNSSAGAYGLRVGVVWWTIGAILAIVYFTCLYRLFRGKVTVVEGEGY